MSSSNADLLRTYYSAASNRSLADAKITWLAANGAASQKSISDKELAWFILNGGAAGDSIDTAERKWLATKGSITGKTNSDALGPALTAVVPVSYISTITPAAAGGITTFTLPTGNVGDLMIACMSTSDPALFDITISGWTLIGRTANEVGNGNARLQAFWRIATGSDGNTITGTSSYSVMIVGRWRNTHQTAPISSFTMNNGITNPVTNAGVTPPVSGCELALFDDNYFGTAAAWSGATSRAQGALGGFSTKTAPASGVPTGTLNQANGSLVSAANMVICIRPA